MSDDTKIHVDDDWKSEAAAEKERLGREVDQKAASAGTPVAEFAGLVQLLAMQAMVGLGGFAGPDGQRVPPNIELAKLHIDMLDVLEKKTAGNLEPQEKQMLDTTLHQLRMAYIETCSGGGAGPAPAPAV